MIELRTPNLVDMNRHSQWAHEPEIAALDPPAGAVINPMFWSIYLDYVHIGTVSIYNRYGLSGELGILIGDKTKWSRGHGTEAIEQMLKLCEGAGFTEIHLKVLPHNTRAIRCYEKCGFTRVGYISHDGVPFLQMSRRIQQKGNQDVQNKIGSRW